MFERVLNMPLLVITQNGFMLKKLQRMFKIVLLNISNVSFTIALLIYLSYFNPT